MSQLMKNTISFRNDRGEYLFCSEHSYDNQSTHIVLTTRSGRVIRQYDIPIPLRTTEKAMIKAGWKKVNF